MSAMEKKFWVQNSAYKIGHDIWGKKKVIPDKNL
jgi:hypothetical protein